MAINKSKSKMPFSESKCSLAKVSLNKTPAQAFTPPADEKKMHGHNLDICVLRRLRLRQGQIQGFLGLKVGEGGC